MLLNKPLEHINEQKVSLITTRHHHHHQRDYIILKIVHCIELAKRLLFVSVCKNNLCSLADHDDDDDDGRGGVDDEKRSLYVRVTVEKRDFHCVFFIFYVLFNGGIYIFFVFGMMMMMIMMVCVICNKGDIGLFNGYYLRISLGSLMKHVFLCFF